jgi:predicted permease
MMYLRYSVEIVATLMLGAACGAVLVRRRILHEQALRDLSAIVMNVTLPCLLLSNIVPAVSVAALARWWLLPVAALLNIGAGLLVGWLGTRMARTPAELERGAIAQIACGNGAYIPLAVIAVLLQTHPQVFGDMNAATIGVTYASLYLVAYSPLQWGVIFPFLTHKPLRDLRLRQIVSMPMIAGLGAVIIGLLPWTKALLIGPHAPLAAVQHAAAIIGQATVPCALLIIGGNLAHGPHPAVLRWPTTVCAGLGRFVIMPLVALAGIMVFRALGVLPVEDKVLCFVLLLQGFVPPAMNLMVMYEILGRCKKDMAALMFWLYCAAIPMMALWLTIGMRVVQ